MSAVDLIESPLFRTVFAGVFSTWFIQAVKSTLVVELAGMFCVIGVNEGSAGIEITTVAGDDNVVSLSSIGLLKSRPSPLI